MDRSRRSLGGRKVLVVFGLVALSLATSGCAYDSLTARADRAEGRLVDLQRQNNELETRLAVRQGEIRELQRKYSDLQITNERLQDELRSIRPDDVEEPMDGAGITNAAAPGKRTGFEEIDSVESRRDGDQIRLTLPQHVLFDPGAATLRSNSRGTLTKIAEVLQRDHGKPSIRVEGHTDNVPVSRAKKKFPTNWELSAARASSVLRALGAANAVDLSTSYVVGYGEQRPVADNNEKEGRRANRRVEIVILP